MSLYKKNIDDVLIKLLQDVQSEFAKTTGGKQLDQYTPLDSRKVGELGVLDKMSLGINALYHANSIANTACDKVPEVPTVGDVSNDWFSLVLNELKIFNANGFEYIGSCSEALIKSHGLMNELQKDPTTRKPIFYRGETNYGWDLIPRVYRVGKCKHDVNNPSTVTDCELKLLNRFIEHVNADSDLKIEIFNSKPVYQPDDPAWWGLMAHYDNTGGTRMIDIKSSLFCGLFFACAGWDGEIDTKKDGALYIMPRSGRKETKPDDDEWMETSESYYNISIAEDYHRFRKARDRNDRLVAQDGYFFWQPRFDQPLELPQPF